jgi:uncharacterized membrane protein YgcG
MWVQKGQRVQPNGFSPGILQPLTKRYFNAQLNLRTFRQMKVSLVREFIPPALHVGGGDNTSDLSNDHSTPTARKFYGIVEGDLPLLTEDAIWEFRAFNQEVWCLLGLGPRPPQEALRLIRRNLPIVSAPHPTPASPVNSGASSHNVSADHYEMIVAGIVDKSVDKAVTDAFSKAIPRLLRRVEREMVDDLLPVLIQSALASITAPTGTDAAVEPATQGSRGEPIEVSSDAMSIIDISTDDHGADQEDDEEDDSELEYLDYDYDNHDDSGSGGGGHSGSGGGSGGGSSGGGSSQDSWGGNGGYRGGGSGSGSRGGNGVGGPEPSILSDRVKFQKLMHDNGIVKSTVPKIVGDIEEFENILVNDSDFSSPAPLQSRTSTFFSRAREGIRRALNDPDAVERSPEQLELVALALEGEKDVVAVMPTGGGKSMAWDATALADPDHASVVMVPYTLLLEQHLSVSLGRGIIAFKFTGSCTPPDNFQIIYLQPETRKSVAYQQ